MSGARPGTPLPDLPVAIATMTPRLLFLDIETSDLKGDFGNMIAFEYKFKGESTHVISLLDVNQHCRTCKRVDAVDDKELVKKAHGVLSQADVICTW